MFENIIGQERAIDQLRQQVSQQQLPPAILLHGPQYSGKLSSALELARVLSCKAGEGAWSCGCAACVQHRTLDHPLTLMTGSRYFVQDIAACAEALKKAPMRATVYLFLRSVQKLLRRFDPVLWQGEENRLTKSMTQLETIRDALDGIAPEVDLPPPDKLDKRIQQILEAAARIMAARGSDNIPIHTIRSIAYWSHLSSGDSHKVVILENAERMHDSSRNALLKVLEEPPAGLTFVLLSGNRAAIPATIRSRVRPYAFSERDGDQTKIVLRKIFRETEPRYHSIRHYIMQNAYLSRTGFDMLARQFLELVLAEQNEQPAQRLETIAAELNEAANKDGYRYFFEELSAACRRILQREQGQPFQASLPLSLLQGWQRELVRHQRYSESFYMRGDLVLQSLWFAMRKQHAKVH
ncbi:MAG: hypothetical protein EA404_04385 [Spirochaetaceae bacterium]|nr:MAG: hypothetical protein EA404_04385 [Spirochaetaceae bacterium]